MLIVEDRAEIRRLHRAEQMSISQIARVLGIVRNTVRAALVVRGATKVRAPPSGVGRGYGRATEPGVAVGVSDNAGDGECRADRLDPLNPSAQRPA
jgi:hypothetical protein